MNIAETAIQKKTITIAVTIVLLIAGIQSYLSLGRLEDPEFTIKEAQIFTPYPGATPSEVEEEVTEVIEKAIQQLGQLERVKSSMSVWGGSIVTAEIKNKYDKNSLPQVWDELRRKVNDAQSKLPPGAGPSLVNDDFGDVYGAFVTLSSKPEDYSFAELKELAKFLQRELLLVKDVKRIELFGDKTEAVYVEISREKMAALGIAPNDIMATLQNQNLVSDAGHFKVSDEYIPIRPSGEFASVEDIGNLIITRESSDRLIYLKDVADVRRGYVEPQDKILRFNGAPAIGLALSTAAGGNVVEMGEALKKRFNELRSQIPVGIEFGIVALQSDAVIKSIDGFILNLVEAVIIVIVVLMAFMGLRSGILIGFILVVTIVSSFFFMKLWGVMLERISLGALIIALGMLVDNAIVITEGMLIKIEKGEDRVKAAGEVGAQNMWPLFGATLIAVLAFGAIGLSQDSTGEYCRSLFQVLCISLLMSWITAMTLTPLLCVWFLKGKPAGAPDKADPYDKPMFRLYRRFLGVCQHRRWVTITVVLVLLGSAVYGFKYVDNSFFPDSTRPQFMVDFWLPEGTHIKDTEALCLNVEKYLQGLTNVTDVTTVIGGGAPRFLLTYAPERPNPAYAQFIISVSDYKAIKQLDPQIQEYLDSNYPDELANVKQFLLGPGEGGKIQIRISGPDKTKLRELAGSVMHIMQNEPNAKGVRQNWREMIKVIRPEYSEVQARRTGITRPNLAEVMQIAYDGKNVSHYRERDLLLPIKLRAPKTERDDVKYLRDTQVWSPIARKFMPASQIAPRFETVFNDSQIWRRDRKKTITVHCDQKTGVASVLLERIWPKITALEIPAGYTIVRGGEYEDSSRAKGALASNIPAFLIAMIMIVIFLFNAVRQPLIIWLTVPLALIGVTLGLLLTNQPFGFMAMLGFLSLTGMLIKNSIVLIDQIDMNIREGMEPFQAVMDACVSRMRPVLMAAGTTVLGMMPLLLDAFFVAMAVTIMFGLTFASFLTLIVVPVLYAIFFKIKYKKAAV